LNLENIIQQFSVLKQMHPVGRLDADTTGLLLFSREGTLTHNLLNPLKAVEREYEAIVKGTVNFEKLKFQLSSGVQTTDGTFTAALIESAFCSEAKVN
jgi:23S rRNA pseudouridine2605 synthase